MRMRKPRSSCTSVSFWSSVGLAAVLLCGASPAVAATAASLGTAESFAVLGGSTVTNTGPTVITADVGVSPGSAISGFPPGLVVGAIHAADAVALQAQSDVTTAYNDLAGQACDVDLTGQDLGGLTLTPGVYCFSSSAQLTGDLSLDAEGDPDAVFVFQMGSTLTTASNSSVRLINAAQDCNVFWQVGSSATLGTETTLIGNVLALTSITLTTGASVSGRALARNGAVTLDTNDVGVSGCGVPARAPALRKTFSPATINGGGVSRLTITLINPNPSAADLTAALTDTLPGGVVIAAIPNAITTCAGTGAVIAAAGGTTVTLPDTRSIPAVTGDTAGTCTVKVNVTAAAAGSYLNTLAVDALQTSHGNNAAPAIATLTVVTRAPALRKSFDPVEIHAGGVSTLTIRLINPNPGPADLTLRLRDTLPRGVVIAATPNAVTTCPGTGAVIATAGGTTVTLPDTRSIPAGTVNTAGSCTVRVDVTAATAGSYLNTLAVNALQSSNGNNATPAIATLTVVTRAPALRKTFTPVKIHAGGVSTLTIRLINPNPRPAHLTLPLTDTLPSGVVIAGTPRASTTCPGTGAVIATAGGTTVTLPETRAIPAGSGGAAGSCTVQVQVTATAAGSYLNTLAVNALQTSHGNNATPAVATLTVEIDDDP
jgi:ice-binding like protein